MDLFPGRQGTSDASKAGSDPRARARPTWNGWPADAPPPAIAPFDAAQARAHQEAWAKHLGMPVELTNSIGMKFVLIPPGKFTMGSSQKEIDFWPSGLPKTRSTGQEQLPVKVRSMQSKSHVRTTWGNRGHGRAISTIREGNGIPDAGRAGRRTFRRFPNGEWKMDADTNWLNPGFAQTDHHPVVCVSLE